MPEIVQDEPSDYQLAKFRRVREPLAKLLKDNMGLRGPKLREYLLYHFLDTRHVGDIFDKLLWLALECDDPKVNLMAVRTLIELHDGPMTQKIEGKLAVARTKLLARGSDGGDTTGV